MTPSVLGAFVAATLAAHAATSWLRRRAAERACARVLDGYGVVEEPGRRRLDPFPVRVAATLVVWASRMGRRVSPGSYVDRTQHRLTVAGRDGRPALHRFFAARFGAAVLALPAAALSLELLHVRGALALALFALLAAIALLGPDAVLSRQVEQRLRTIRKNLPDFLDLLTISVEAGLGFEQALERIAAELEGPLPKEFQQVLGETRAGASRAAAMRALADRLDTPEISSFVLAVIQADSLGISIGDVLRSQSEEIRVKWRQRAQERALKAPVKMLVPTVFCIFPSLFVVILGPAILRIASAGM